MYKGIVITKDEAGYTSQITEIASKPLQEGEVRVEVKYSTLNYKDALAITGRSPVVRSFPLTPGIDFSGVVIESKHPAWKERDEVLLNGWGVGEKYFGGLAEQVTVSGDWLIQNLLLFLLKIRWLLVQQVIPQCCVSWLYKSMVLNQVMEKF
jgi:acrylyl-CoA reductase (NADPH)